VRYLILTHTFIPPARINNVQIWLGRGVVATKGMGDGGWGWRRDSFKQ